MCPLMLGTSHHAIETDYTDKYHYCYLLLLYTIFRPGNGSASAKNVVVVGIVVI